MVSGAKRALFMASDWNGEELIEERHCWYEANPDLSAAIVAGWKQLAEDLATYVPPEVVERVTAAPVETLPAVSVQMQGALTVISNLDVFGAMLRAFVEKIPKKPTTDQEFADAAAAVKALEKAEEALDAAEANAIGQVRSVEELTRTIATLREVSATARKATNRMVEDRKKQIRVDEVRRGKDAFGAHIDALNKQIGKNYMPPLLGTADFAGAISGRKTIDSLRNAIDTELARVKIAASEIAGTIILNLTWLRENAAAYSFLFADAGIIVLKQPDDLQALATNRINAHKAAEEKKEADTRERIRAEEAEKLQREQEARDRETARQVAEAAKPAATPAPVATAAPAVSSNAQNVVPMGTRAPAPTQLAPRTLTLTAIAQRLGFALPAAFVAEKLGVAGEKDRSAVKFSEPEFIQICAALAHHIGVVLEEVRRQRAA